MILILTLILLIYIAGFYFSPFPYWKTYSILWYTVLFDKNDIIDGAARRKQARFLSKYALLCPVWTLLWYLDDFFYPEYKTISVRPVFIMGQPRSGTTFLHRTLAADENNFVALRHIEWRFPYICFQKLLSRASWAKKIMQRDYWPDSSAGRVASKMHPNKLSDWEEDGIFFEECFLHHFFIFLRFPYPDLLKYLDNFPALPEKVQNKMLETHRKVIQKIMFIRGDNNKYYLSKEVTSHNKFQKILKLYPGAKFIFSVRHSADFMNSLLSLVRFSTSSKIGVDPINIPMWKKVFVERMKRDSNLLCELCEDKVENDNQVRIMFNRFTRDIVSSTEHIYSTLGFELFQSYRAHLNMINERQQERDRGYDYEKNAYQGFEAFDAFVNRIDSEFSRTLRVNSKKKMNSREGAG